MEATPPTPAANVESPITITDEAAERLKAEIDNRDGDVQALRLMVFPGGCAGLQYSLSFSDGEPEDFEAAFESNGITLYVDGRYLEMLEGSSIAYIDNLIGGGFQVKNPNAQQSCGCGKSFS